MLNGWEKLYKVLHMQINRQSHLKFTLPDTFVGTTSAPPPPTDSLQDGIETMTIYNTGRGGVTKDHHRYSSGRSVLTKYVVECGIIIN